MHFSTLSSTFILAITAANAVPNAGGNSGAENLQKRDDEPGVIRLWDKQCYKDKPSYIGNKVDECVNLTRDDESGDDKPGDDKPGDDESGDDKSGDDKEKEQPEFNNKAVSGKAKPGFACTLYRDEECKGKIVTFRSDGEPKIVSGKPQGASSWKCRRGT